MTILEDISIRPGVVIETHGVYDAPTDEVASVLEDLGYSIASEVVADPDLEAVCREKDIKVPTATR